MRKMKFVENMRFGELRNYIPDDETVSICEANYFLGNEEGIRDLFRGKMGKVPECINKLAVISFRVIDGVLDIFLNSREEEEAYGTAKHLEYTPGD